MSAALDTIRFVGSLFVENWMSLDPVMVIVGLGMIVGIIVLISGAVLGSYLREVLEKQAGRRSGANVEDVGVCEAEPAESERDDLGEENVSSQAQSGVEVS
jgi:hypothetical protein